MQAAESFGPVMVSGLGFVLGLKGLSMCPSSIYFAFEMVPKRVLWGQNIYYFPKGPKDLFWQNVGFL